MPKHTVGGKGLTKAAKVVAGDMRAAARRNRERKVAFKLFTIMAAPKPQIPLQRRRARIATAYCNGCERKVRLRQDGTFQRHVVRTLSVLCPGSGLTPESAALHNLWGSAA